MLELPRSHVRSLKDKFQRLKSDKLNSIEELQFLRTWVENPLKTGAVAPSGADLAHKMVSFVEVGPHTRVLELGPGTGSVTKALLERGIRHQNLTTIEYSPEFCRHLRSRFPGIHVVEGDAYSIGKTLGAENGTLHFDAIVSSLPLLNRPDNVRAELLAEVFRILPPGAPFIQFSYGLLPPVKPSGDVKALASGWIWKNLPPARVWVYRQCKGPVVASTGGR